MIKEFTPPGLHLLVQFPTLGLIHYAQKYVFTSSNSAPNSKKMSSMAPRQLKTPIWALSTLKKVEN